MAGESLFPRSQRRVVAASQKRMEPTAHARPSGIAAKYRVDSPENRKGLRNSISGRSDVRSTPTCLQCTVERHLAYMVATEKLRGELIPILQGLGQSQCLAPAGIAFRKAVIQEMNSIVRQHLPISINDDNESVTSASTQASSRRSTLQERSNTLSRNLRALSPEDAEASLVKVYCEIGEGLRRLGLQVKILLDIISSMDKSPEGNSPEESTQILDMPNLLDQAAEKAQSEMIKVLRVRNEQTVRLGLTGLLRYFALNWLFVNECEAISGHSGKALIAVVDKQIRDFVPIMHEVEMQKLAQRMEAEKWERIDFKSEDAVILANTIQSAITDPPAWLIYTDVVSTSGLETDEQGLQSSETFAELSGAAQQGKQDPKPAIIEDGKFSLIASTTFALHGIQHYTILLASLPKISNAISIALLAYLNLFNSRTQQLILDAGAERPAGLPNINTKHLALASQSLSFFITLLPYLRECVRRRASVADSDVAGYERLGQVLRDHRSAIHDKFVKIMGARATVCIKAMRKIDWDDKDEVMRGVSPHMEMITKETLTLRRVLEKYMPAVSVRVIVGRVLERYKELWNEAFEGVVV